MPALDTSTPYSAQNYVNWDNPLAARLAREKGWINPHPGDNGNISEAESQRIQHPSGPVIRKPLAQTQTVGANLTPVDPRDRPGYVPPTSLTPEPGKEQPKPFNVSNDAIGEARQLARQAHPEQFPGTPEYKRLQNDDQAAGYTEKAVRSIVGQQRDIAARQLEKDLEAARNSASARAQLHPEEGRDIASQIAEEQSAARAAFDKFWQQQAEDATRDALHSAVPAYQDSSGQWHLKSEVAPRASRNDNGEYSLSEADPFGDLSHDYHAENEQQARGEQARQAASLLRQQLDPKNRPSGQNVMPLTSILPGVTTRGATIRKR